jgi:ATP-dependent Lon protease
MPRISKKTKRPGQDDDNSSVDSKGNIRGLIDYDYDSDDDMIMAEPGIILYKQKPTDSSKRTRYSRTAKDRANKKIKKIIKSMEEPQASTPAHKNGGGVTITYTLNGEKKSRIMKDSEIFDEEMSESEDDEEDIENTDDEDDSDQSEDDDAMEEDEERSETSRRRLKAGEIDTIGDTILQQLFSDGKTPKKHNMKKEPLIVRNFVKLITSPLEENDIDTQIDQFKSLAKDRQEQIIKTLEARPPATDASSSIMFKILDMDIAPEIKRYVMAKYQNMQNMETSNGEYFKVKNWLEKVSSVPFGKYKQMPVSLTDGQEKCEDFMKYAKKTLDDAVFGQIEAKLQILQFIAAKISNPTADGVSLLLVGPPGIGKTSLIKNGIAKALQWPFQFISLGGETDASTYTGHQVVFEGSHSGKILDSIIAAKSMSSVMMFDEIDKISNTPKGEEIQNLLVHMTDPVQNMYFEDKYLANIPIDLSKMMFVFSANDINKIDRILLDRMRVVQLKGYSLAEKTKIAEVFLIPEALQQVNLQEKVRFDKSVIEYIIENHAKEESGVRELRRSIDQICQKINMLRMYNSKDLTFHIPDFQLPFIVKKDHVDLFIKKKDTEDTSYRAMYI